MYKSTLFYIILQLITYSLNAKLVYNCKSVHFDNKKYKDINVVFMTGFEILKDVPYEQKLVTKGKKYAVVILADEKMMIVELDEPNINSKSAIEMGVAGLNGRTPNIEDLAAQESNPDDDAFYHEYKTNCRLEFTKNCLKDSGNTILYGRDLENKYIVTISPNEYIGGSGRKNDLIY